MSLVTGGGGGLGDEQVWVASPPKLAHPPARRRHCRCPLESQEKLTPSVFSDAQTNIPYLQQVCSGCDIIYILKPRPREYCVELLGCRLQVNGLHACPPHGG
eukprot:gene10467-biopygen2992